MLPRVQKFFSCQSAVSRPHFHDTITKYYHLLKTKTYQYTEISIEYFDKRVNDANTDTARYASLRALKRSPYRNNVTEAPGQRLKKSAQLRHNFVRNVEIRGNILHVIVVF